jgi:hypothetical protein
MGGTPELRRHRAARWAASVLVCATLAVAGAAVAVETAGVARADQVAHQADEGDGGDQGSGGGGDQSSGGGDEGSGGGGCGQCEGGSGAFGGAVPNTIGAPGPMNGVPSVPHLPLPAPVAPPAISPPAMAPPPIRIPTSNPILPRRPSRRRPAPAAAPQPAPAPARQPVVVQQPAPVARHAVPAPAARRRRHRAAHGRQPRAHERRPRHATQPTSTAPVKPLREEPGTGVSHPGGPLAGAVAARTGGQRELTLLAALPAIALLLPLLILVFLKRRRY